MVTSGHLHGWICDKVELYRQDLMAWLKFQSVIPNHDEYFRLMQIVHHQDTIVHGRVQQFSQVMATNDASMMLTVIPCKLWSCCGRKKTEMKEGVERASLQPLAEPSAWPCNMISSAIKLILHLQIWVTLTTSCGPQSSLQRDRKERCVCIRRDGQ